MKIETVPTAHDGIEARAVEMENVFWRGDLPKDGSSEASPETGLWIASVKASVGTLEIGFNDGTVLSRHDEADGGSPEAVGRGCGEGLS